MVRGGVMREILLHGSSDENLDDGACAVPVLR